MNYVENFNNLSNSQLRTVQEFYIDLAYEAGSSPEEKEQCLTVAFEIYKAIQRTKEA